MGRYAVPHLTAVLIVCFIIGYLIGLVRSDLFNYMTLEPAYILRGQVWRLITWLVIPPSSFGIFTLVMLFFYFSIGTVLERTWGDFRYNVYIFTGLLITVVTAFVCYFILSAKNGGPVVFGSVFSTYYICMSIFLAYALTYPDMQVLLMFVIPIRVKWLGVIYGLYIAYDVFTYLRMYIQTKNPLYIVLCAAIVASIANFLIFFFTTRDYRKVNPKEIKRKRDFRKAVERGKRMNAQNTYRGPYPMNTDPKARPKTGSMGTDAEAAGRNGLYRPAPTRHRCAVCGRTELTDPDMEFRFCSKCDGNLEYCQEHLFTHQHVRKGNDSNV